MLPKERRAISPLRRAAKDQMVSACRNDGRSSTLRAGIELPTESAKRPNWCHLGDDLESFHLSGCPSRVVRTVLHHALQPGTGVGPVAVGRRAGDAERISRLIDRQADEEPQLDHLGRVRLFGGELRQGFIERQQFVAALGSCDVCCAAATSTARAIS